MHDILEATYLCMQSNRNVKSKTTTTKTNKKTTIIYRNSSSQFKLPFNLNYSSASWKKKKDISFLNANIKTKKILLNNITDNRIGG